MSVGGDGGIQNLPGFPTLVIFKMADVWVEVLGGARQGVLFRNQVEMRPARQNQRGGFLEKEVKYQGGHLSVLPLGD